MNVRCVLLITHIIGYEHPEIHNLILLYDRIERSAIIGRSSGLDDRWFGYLITELAFKVN